MIARLFIFLCFVLQVVSSVAQTPLPPEGSSWFMANYGGFIGYTGNSTLVLQGDSTVGDLSYKKLSTDYGSHTALLRSETDIWYAINPNDTLEYVLYDFGLNVADTFWVSMPPYTEDHVPYMIVDSMDVVTLLNSLERQRWFLSYPNWGTVQWVEGIGCLEGPVDAVPWYLFDTGGSNLVCYHEYGELLYEEIPSNLVNYAPFGTGNTTTYTYSNCSITLGMPELSASSFSLYPNPVSHEFLVERSGFAHPANWSVLSMEGRLVLQGTIPAGEKTHRLSAAEIPDGIYLFQLESPSSSVTRRLVVRH